MGTVNNVWLTKNIFMSYLAAENPISEKVSFEKNVSQITMTYAKQIHFIGKEKYC